MTCIVGMTQAGKVYMGADSAGVAGLEIRTRADTKLFNKEGYLIGCTTSFRMIQLLRFGLSLPKRHPEEDLYEFMCTKFIDSVRSTFKAGGFGKNESGNESGGCFLVGVSGRLFRVDSDFQVGEDMLNFAACGCGEYYALGALHATITSNAYAAPMTHLEAALNTAAEFSAGVRGPFNFMEV